MYLLFVKWGWIIIQVSILMVFTWGTQRRRREAGFAVSEVAAAEENPPLSDPHSSRPCCSRVSIYVMSLLCICYMHLYCIFTRYKMKYFDVYISIQMNI